MRALTVKQPYAGAIAHQSKTIENRSWALPAKHVGTRLLIHAGAQRDKDAQVYGDNLHVHSAIIAVATLKGCHFDSGTDPCCSEWAMSGYYHWELSDVTALPEPVPCKGRLGLWTPDADVQAAVQQQLTPTPTETAR